MPEILTYNTPPKIAKERTKQPFYISFFDWFSSQERFTKTYIIVFLLIILATPFITSQYLNYRQRAAENQPIGPVTPPAQYKAVPDEILVKFKAGTKDKAKKSVEEVYGLNRKESIPKIGVDVFKVPSHAKDKTIEALGKNKHVEYAEPNF